MLAWIELWWWQRIVAIDLLVVHDGTVAYLPDEVVSGFTSEPRLKDATDAEALVLTSEEAPRALQPKPELHKAFLIIPDFHTSSCISRFYNSARSHRHRQYALC